MDVYNYVAQNNPSKSRAIMESFGYSINNSKDLGACLRQLVVEEGEPALREILNSHPDREILIELYSNFDGGNKAAECEECKKHSIIESYKSANGLNESNKQEVSAKSVENNFSIVFLAGIMLLSIAILKTK